MSINSVAQISGQIVPLLAATIAVPLIYRRLSPPDFGIFTLVLTALGFFSVMDFGIGRGAVRFVSRALGEGNITESEVIAGQSILVLAAFSGLLCIAFAVYLPGIAQRWVPNLGGGAARIADVIYILAASIPFICVSAALRSVLEAHERFPTIALVQGVTGALTYAVPVICVFHSANISVVAAGAVSARVLNFGVMLAVARRFCRFRLSWHSFGSLRTRQFLGFSGWLIVSNVVGNAVVYSDRALLARLVPLGRLPYYNVPLEFLTRLMIVVNGAISVAFPILSRASTESSRLDRIYSLGIAVLGLCAGPVLLVCTILAPVGLNAWLGAAFRLHSTEVVRTLIVGLLCLSLNALSLASLNARGVSKIIALMHVIEAPFYIWGLWLLGRRYGIEGLALVWSARMGFELLCFATMQLVLSANRRLLSFAFLLSGVQAIPLIAVAWTQAVAMSLMGSAAIMGITLFWIRGVLRRGNAFNLMA